MKKAPKIWDGTLIDLVGEIKSIELVGELPKIEVYEEAFDTTWLVSGDMHPDISDALKRIEPHVGDRVWIERWERQGDVHYDVLPVRE